MFKLYLKSILLTSILLVCFSQKTNAHNTRIDHRQSSTSTFTYEFNDPDGIQRITAYYGARHLYPISKIVFINPNCPESITVNIDRFIIRDNKNLNLSRINIIDCTGMGTEDDAYSMTFWDVNAEGTVINHLESTHTQESLDFLDTLDDAIEEGEQWIIVDNMYKLLKILICLLIFILILLLIALFKWFALGPFFKQ